MNASRNFALLFLSCTLLTSPALAATPQDVIWQTTASRAIAISYDAQYMLTGVQVRNTSGTLLRTLQFGYSGGSVNADAFAPDGQTAAIAIQAYNRNLFLFRVTDGVQLAGNITAHLNGTTCVAFSPNGTYLASGGRDGTVKIWHVPDMTLVRTLNGGVGYRPRVFAVVWSKDNSTIILGGQGGVLQYRVADGELLRVLTKVPTISLAIGSDGWTLATGSNQIDQYGQCVDCTIKLFRVWDGAPLLIIPGNNNGITSLAFSPDEGELAAGSGDRVYSGSVRFFNAQTGQLLGTWLMDPNNPSSYVTSVVYGPFGRVFTYARADSVVTAAWNPF